MKPAISFLCAASIFFLFGCKNNVTSPQMSGTISGHVELDDTLGARYFDRSGVMVQLLGTGNQTTTDSSGKWSFTNISAGIYTIVYSKNGFGLSKDIDVQFVGGGEIVMPTVLLQNYPNDVFTLNLVTGSTFLIEDHTKNSGSKINASYLLVIGKDGILNPLDSSNYMHGTRYPQTNPNGQYETQIQTINFYDFGFQKGKTYYACIYGIGEHDLVSGGALYGSEFYEPHSQQNLYSATGPKSNVLSFIMP